MWHLKKIPKIAHFYFGNKILPYMRYLTIKTFVKCNPDWKVIFHYPKYVCKNSITWGTGEQYKGIDDDVKSYYDELSKLTIEIREHDFTKYNIPNDISEVFKSDILRWILLGSEGGLWSDMDIIYFKSMDSIHINKIKNSNVDSCIARYKGGDNAIGFILSSANNLLFQKVQGYARMSFNSNDYQCMGSKVLNSHFKSDDIIKYKLPSLNPMQISEETVYPFTVEYIENFFKKDSKIHKDAIGVHWYAGTKIAKLFENIIDEENINLISFTTFGKCLKE